MKNLRPLYGPPDGFEDFPFIWGFDGSVLTNGQNALNQFVYIEGGWGNFIMRRCVGLSTVLNTAGSFLLRDAQNRPLSSDQILIGTVNDDFAFPNEVPYRETTKIGFDLQTVLKGAVPQIAFQGIRRLPIRSKPVSDLCDYDERTFTYPLSGTITAAGPAKAPLVLAQTINDYDFDLYQVILSYAGAGLPAIVATVQIYDAAHNKISNIPIADVFLNGAPGSTYKNGAIVPPLRYRQQTQIKVEVFSQTAVNPITVNVTLVGKQRIPRS